MDRLVALAMKLGMAEEEMESDPEAAREKVGRARNEALTALGELRDLSRGIRPAMLEERGPSTAIDSLAERSPLPVSVRLVGELDEMPDATQTAAYFVVAEALTDAVRHSGADRIRVTFRCDEARLAVSVEDNGKGGAETNGSGLDGLQKRVRALDGRLAVASPVDGPTVISTEIPCG